MVVVFNPLFTVRRGLSFEIGLRPFICWLRVGKLIMIGVPK